MIFAGQAGKLELHWPLEKSRLWVQGCPSALWAAQAWKCLSWAWDAAPWAASTERYFIPCDMQRPLFPFLVTDIVFQDFVHHPTVQFQDKIVYILQSQQKVPASSKHSTLTKTAAIHCRMHFGDTVAGSYLAFLCRRWTRRRGWQSCRKPSSWESTSLTPLPFMETLDLSRQVFIGTLSESTLDYFQSEPL